jgi:hypothetical protein
MSLGGYSWRRTGDVVSYPSSFSLRQRLPEWHWCYGRRLAYQPPANCTFFSEQTSHYQPAISTFFSEQISISHQQPAKRTGCMNRSYDGFDFSVKSKSYTPLIKQLIHQRLMCIVESVILPLHSFGLLHHGKIVQLVVCFMGPLSGPN